MFRCVYLFVFSLADLSPGSTNLLGTSSKARLLVMSLIAHEPCQRPPCMTISKEVQYKT